MGEEEGIEGHFLNRSFDSRLKSIAQRRKAFTRGTRLGSEAFCCCPSADVVGATPEFLLYTHTLSLGLL